MRPFWRKNNNCKTTVKEEKIKTRKKCLALRGRQEFKMESRKTKAARKQERNGTRFLQVENEEWEDNEDGSILEVKWEGREKQNGRKGNRERKWGILINRK